MKFSLIIQQKNTYPIRLLCQVLGVSRPCDYHHRRQMANTREGCEHRDMLEWIKANDELSAHRYGRRRMKKALNGLGYSVSRHKVRKLMREADVAVRDRKKYKVTTNSNHKQPVFDNLLQRQFLCHSPIKSTRLTSHTCGPRKAGYTSPWSLTSVPEKSWAGA